jgi:hypothetical protein
MDNDEYQLQFNIPELYPPVSELMTALQDEGKESKDKDGGKLIHYPKLQRFSKKLYNKLIENSVTGFPANPSRNATIITSIINTLRRMVDTSSLYEPLRKYCKRTDNRMYVIQNDVNSAGYQLILDQISHHLNTIIIKAGGARNKNDALRVCGILLDSKYRSTVHALMKNKKDRAACDLGYDPVLAFCDEAVVDFNDKDYIVPDPDYVYELDGYATMNANDPTRTGRDRSGGWFWNLWKDYFRPKYCSALDKWYSDTGGGDGRLSSFQNFCLEKEKFVAWVFLLDRKHLLQSNASSMVPKELSNEPGANDNNGDLKTPASKKKRKLSSEQQYTNDNVVGIHDTAKELLAITSDLIQSAKQQQNNVELSPESKSFTKIEAINKHQKMIMDDPCYSPFTKERMRSKFDTKKRSLARDMLEDDSVVARALPMDNYGKGIGKKVQKRKNVPMHQSFLKDFDVSSSDEDDE